MVEGFYPHHFDSSDEELPLREWQAKRAAARQRANLVETVIQSLSPDSDSSDDELPLREWQAKREAARQRANLVETVIKSLSPDYDSSDEDDFPSLDMIWDPRPRYNEELEKMRMERDHQLAKEWVERSGRAGLRTTAERESTNPWTLPARELRALKHAQKKQKISNRRAALRGKIRKKKLTRGKKKHILRGGGEAWRVIKESEYDDEVIQKDIPTLVNFFAPWCGHCQALKPEWIESSNELKGRANLLAVDCTDDNNKSLMEELDIKGFPTIKVYKKDTNSRRGCKTYVGGRSSKDIVEWVNNYIDKKGGKRGRRRTKRKKRNFKGCNMCN